MTGWHGKKDAFGQAMWDYLNGKGSCEICERDDGGIAASPGPMCYFAEFKNWVPYEKKAVRLARGRVLDIGCGAGRVALYLQNRGMDVLGIDNSTLAIKTCRKRGLRKARVMPITQVSRKLGEFDTIVMFGNNFGLFGSFDGARRMLKRFAGMTGPKARILANTFDPYQTDDEVHLNYHRFNRRRGRMGGQARIRIRYRTYATPYFDYLLVSKDEMTEIVAGTGWRITKFFDSGSPRYVAVMEKE